MARHGAASKRGVSRGSSGDEVLVPSIPRCVTARDVASSCQPDLSYRHSLPAQCRQFLRVLSDCVAIRQEQDEAEAGGDDEAHTSVH